MVSITAFVFAAIRMGGSPVAVTIFLLSPPVIHCLLNANLDWMPLVGFVLPPWIGLFLIAVKPQMGSVLAVFWLIEAWRQGGLSKVVKDFAPVTISLAASFVIFGAWPLNSIRVLSYSQGWNASLWPISVPIGLALTVAAIRLRRVPIRNCRLPLFVTIRAFSRMVGGCHYASCNYSKTDCSSCWFMGTGNNSRTGGIKMTPVA